MKEHPDDQRRKRSIRKWSDPRYALLVSSKCSAKTKKLEHSLTKEDIIIPTYCPVFGYKLKAGGVKKDSMSLDRIDSSKGYTPDNVCVISFRANRLKNNATLEELERLVAYMKKEK